MAEFAGGHERGVFGRGVAHRVADEVGDDAFQQGRVGENGRQVVGYVESDGMHRRSEVVERGWHDLVEPDGSDEDAQGTGLEPAHVEQVLHQPDESIQGLLRGGEPILPLLHRPPDLGAAQTRDGRLGRGQRCPEVVADRGEERRSGAVGGRKGHGGGGRFGESALLESNGGLCGERGEHSPVGCDQGAAAKDERQVLADRDVDVTFLGPVAGVGAGGGDGVPAAAVGG